MDIFNGMDIGYVVQLCAMLCKWICAAVKRAMSVAESKGTYCQIAVSAL